MHLKMSSIHLCDINTCTQCHACESVCPKQCIDFKEAESGFFIPIIDKAVCVECGACINVCHQISYSKGCNLPLYTYAAWSLDENVRTSSSSGGVFSEIARYIIANDGVVVGAVMNKDLKVHHAIANSYENTIPMRGSKYVQSDLSGIYRQVKELLMNGILLLFTGTPCQIAGLNTFLKKDYKNLITCDLVCHGVPSQGSFDTYCDKVCLKRDGVSAVSFRYTQGWGLQMASKKYHASFVKDGKGKWKNISPKRSFYLRAFTKGLMFSEACYSCPYARPERVSDITLADYWGIGSIKPFNYSTTKGVSLLLVNTERGKNVIDECRLFLENRPLEEALKGNHNLSMCSARPSGRDTFCKDLETMSVFSLCRKYGLQPSFKDYLRPLKRMLKI